MSNNCYIDKDRRAFIESHTTPPKRAARTIFLPISNQSRALSITEGYISSNSTICGACWLVINDLPRWRFFCRWCCKNNNGQQPFLNDDDVVALYIDGNTQ
jgi:hypothetical protein